MNCTKCQEQTDRVTLDGLQARCERCQLMFEFNRDVPQNTPQPVEVKGEVRYVVRVS